MTTTPLFELHCVLAQLRHAYAQLRGGYVTDLREFADGLVAPQIRRLEELQTNLRREPGYYVMPATSDHDRH